jgi:hypothetical protein
MKLKHELANYSIFAYGGCTNETHSWIDLDVVEAVMACIPLKHQPIDPLLQRTFRAAVGMAEPPVTSSYDPDPHS